LNVSFCLKELSPPGKLDVFIFVLCPHNTLLLDFLPKEKSGLQISLGDFVSFSSLLCIWRSRVFFLLFSGSPVHSSFIATFDDYDGPSSAGGVWAENEGENVQFPWRGKFF
jgi:hypothetical protein